MKTGATFTALAYFSSSLCYARYAASSKISQITTSPIASSHNGDYTTTVSGELIPTHGFGIKKEAPCYMYFYDDLDIDLSFVFLYNAYPLQVTNRHIFFWPERNSRNFTVKFDSNQKYIDTSLLSVYCGDLTDILGRQTIEQENAERVKIGSFPSGPTNTNSRGFFHLEENLTPDCEVKVHFPIDKAPAELSALDRQVLVSSEHGRRTWTFSNFQGKTENTNVWFDVVYSGIESVVPSYQIVAEVVNCPAPTEVMRELEETRGL